jgi:hypothetical protein
MLVLRSQTQLIIGITLAVLMAVTRGYHFDFLSQLPSASWAAFFLAGVYVGSHWMFLALLAEAAGLDVIAVTWGGVDNFCMSPAYIFLLPAYGALWGVGRWYASRHHEGLMTLLPMTMSVLVGASLCGVLSGGGFYFYSGRFQDTDMGEFGDRLIRFFPYELSSLVFYVGAAVILHLAIYAATRVTAVSAATAAR